MIRSVEYWEAQKVWGFRHVAFKLLKRRWSDCGRTSEALGMCFSELCLRAFSKSRS